MCCKGYCSFMKSIIMPKLGDTMEEGRIVNWLIEVGDTIKKGDLIMNIETDKTVLPVESLVSGVVIEILIDEDATVPVGTVLAKVDTTD